MLEDARLVVSRFEEGIDNQSNDACADDSQSGECNIVVPRDARPRRRLELTALENRDRLHHGKSAIQLATRDVIYWVLLDPLHSIRLGTLGLELGDQLVANDGKYIL